jgi:hypothetical protein
MIVSELIEELSKLPKSYEVVVVLAPFESPDHIAPDELDTMTMSAVIHSTSGNDKGKCVYIFGVATPIEDSPRAIYGDN